MCPLCPLCSYLAVLCACRPPSLAKFPFVGSLFAHLFCGAGAGAGAGGSEEGSEELVPRLVLREPVEGGRSVYSGARKVDGLYFLFQVVTLVEPPTPRNPTKVSLRHAWQPALAHACRAQYGDVGSCVSGKHKGCHWVVIAH